MSKPNKDGWIRHRGGKCPVEKGVLVDVRYRDGTVIKGLPADKSYDTHYDASYPFWRHDNAVNDIMAYRLHKPEQVEPAVVANVEQTEMPAKCQGRNCEAKDGKGHSKECLLDAAFDQGWAGPLQWRDRISEIDSTVAALEEERVSLVQKLEAEGFRLIDKRDVERKEFMDEFVRQHKQVLSGAETADDESSKNNADAKRAHADELTELGKQFFEKPAEDMSNIKPFEISVRPDGGLKFLDGIIIKEKESSILNVLRLLRFRPSA